VRCQINRRGIPLPIGRTSKQFVARTLIASLAMLISTVAGANDRILDRPRDLRLLGVVKAINFGSTTDQKIGEVTFLAAGANATVDGVTNAAESAAEIAADSPSFPKIGERPDDKALEQIFGSYITGRADGKDIDIDIPVSNGFYRLQLIVYDERGSAAEDGCQVDHAVEGDVVSAESRNHTKRATSPNGGTVATYVFEVTDGNVDIRLTGRGEIPRLSGLVLSRLLVPAGWKTPPISPGETWLEKTPVSKIDPELLLQYRSLSRDLKMRPKIAAVAEQTLRRDALILETDRDPADVVLRRTVALLADIGAMADAPDLSASADKLAKLQSASRETAVSDAAARMKLYEKACKLRREIAFANPLLDFDQIVFIKRHGALFAHMVDQFYGITAQPGGGLYVLSDAFGKQPKVRDLLADAVVERGPLRGEKLDGGPTRKWNLKFHGRSALLTGEESIGGAFLSPELSFDAGQILFAYSQCKGRRTHIPHNDHSRGHWDEGRCYHIFKVNADGSNLEQLTEGAFNDFDPCWMPSGRIVFNSERRGGYLRCGRICPTYALHDMAADGSDIRRLSFHETHEWHPSVTHDGKILFTRWDYVDRFWGAAHMPWIMAPDGRDPRAIQGNFTDRMTRPDMELDLRAIPGSQKFVATAAAHHGQSVGSLVVVDPRINDDERMAPVKRLTPEVEFPETQAELSPSGWAACYGEAWPLSEDYYLCVYDPTAIDISNMPLDAGYGIYLVDSFGNRELIYRDAEISSRSPIPLRPRPVPPVVPDASRRVAEGEQPEAVVGLVSVYNSVEPWPEGTVIKALRVYQIFPQPMASWDVRHNTGFQIPGTNSVNIARAVLGTAPVEKDGSAHFIAPARKELYFQALDENGMAVQTMRSGTHFVAGEKATCLGCHEPRHATAATARAGTPLAMRRPPSRLKPDVDGTNPFSYPRLVQPVLQRHCVECHAKEADKKAPRLDAGLVKQAGKGYVNIPTTYYASYVSLTPKFGVWKYSDGPPSEDLVSVPGRIGARTSKLHEILKKGHYDVKLSKEEMHRITVWLDSYCPFYGVYDEEAGKAQLRGEVVRPTLE